MAGIGGFRKVRDEGTSSPFMARIFMGLYALRDDLESFITTEDEREGVRQKFDAGVLPLTVAAESVRDSALEITQLIGAHVEEVEQGIAVDFIGDQMNVVRTVDKQLGQAVSRLIQQSIVTTKTCLQGVLQDPLGLDIGCLFQKQSAFEQGLTHLRDDGQEDLAAYLSEIRNWHEPLQDLRRMAEHEGWVAPALGCVRIGASSARVTIPVLDNLRLDEFALATANRVLTTTEELIAYAMKRRIKKPYLVLFEIPPERRNPSLPKRFRVWPTKSGAESGWQLIYHEQRQFL